MNPRYFFILLFTSLMMVFPKSGRAADSVSYTGISEKVVLVECSRENVKIVFSSPSPLFRHILKAKRDHRRLIAAALAFPLPVGFLGVHRLFLGTSPYMPVVYAATLGGCLGAIPLVDFFVIIFTKDLDSCMNNPKVFMWVK